MDSHVDDGQLPAQRDGPLRWHLSAKTLRGKSKLRETAAQLTPNWDGVWETMETRAAVLFAHGVDGPWHLVRPDCVGFDSAERLSRWVHERDDDHFAMKPA